MSASDKVQAFSRIIGYMEPVVFAFGLAVGSFLNVVIDRLPAGLDIVAGRSHCDHCERTLSWTELIPVVSWLLQGGKSRCCHRRLSVQYPAIELVTGIGFVVLYRLAPQTAGAVANPVAFVASLAIFASLVVIFMTDLKESIIPLEASIACFIAAVVRLAVTMTSIGSVLWSHVLTAFVAAAFFFLLWFGSRKRAMGDGDITLAFLIGLVAGWPATLVALYVAFLTGAMAGVILILRGRKTLKSRVPFGPFMILGLAVGLLYGKTVMAYWGFV